MKRYRLGLAAAAIAMIAPISGCAALISPQQTHDYQYAAGDGASLSNLGGIDVRNVLLIANDHGDAQLMFALINTSNASANVEISVGSKTVKETVKAGQALYHNPADKQIAPADDDEGTRVTRNPIVIKRLDTKPGDLATVNFTVNGQPGTVKAQVLTGDLEYYRDVVPSDQAAQPSATPTGTATPATATSPAED